MQFKAVLFKCQEVGSYSFIHNFHVVWGGKKSICLLLFLLLPSVIRWRLYSLVKTVSFDFSNYTNNIKQIDVFQERNGGGGKKRKKRPHRIFAFPAGPWVTKPASRTAHTLITQGGIISFLLFTDFISVMFSSPPLVQISNPLLLFVCLSSQMFPGHFLILKQMQ